MKTNCSRRLIQLCSMLSGVMMFLFAGQAHALLIDTFDTTQGPIIVDEVTPPEKSIADTALGGDMIGGERDLKVTCISGCSDIKRIYGLVDNGVFSHSQDQGVKGYTEITWDGTDGVASALDPTGLGGVDFTDGGSEIGLYYQIIDDDVDVDFTFRAYTDAGNYSELVVPHTGPITNTDFVALYGDFVTVAGTGVDFTHVGALQLFVEASDPNLDLSLDFIRTTGGEACIENCIPQETPEPGTWVLFGTGLLGIVGYGWRRNKGMA